MGLVHHRFTEEDRQFIRSALAEAMETGPQDRTNTGIKGMELPAWEAKNGELNAQMMGTWIRKQGLHHAQVANLVEEFRISMMAKGKRYKNFQLAFQTYLVKGYLSKNIDQVRISNMPVEQGNVRTSTRGVSI